MKNKLIIAIGSLIAIVLIVFLGMKISGKDTIDYSLTQNPQILDPQVAVDTTSEDLIAYLFEGLARTNKDGKLEPAVAEKWEMNGKVWTFKIKENAKWSNGDKIVANDFVSSWERALNPYFESKNSYLMYIIKGAKDYKEGKVTDFSQVGVKALDEKTLQVELVGEYVYFPALTTVSVFMPQNSKYYEKNKENYGKNGKIIGNGSFEIANYKENSKIILEKSKDYWDNENISIKKISILINGDVKTLIQKYNENKLDFVKLGIEDVSNYKDSSDKISWDNGNISYLLFNTENSILSNKKIRKAIALSIDKKELVGKVLGDKVIDTDGLIGNYIVGKKSYFRNDYEAKKLNISFNKDEANKLFDEGLAELGLSRNSIKRLELLCEKTYDSMNEAEFYKQQLTKNLGIVIDIKSSTHQMYEQKVSSKDFDLTIESYKGKFNDPIAYLGKWKSDSTENYSGFKNKDFDNLLSLSNVESNQEKRMEILAKAEMKLLDELPIIPIYFEKENAIIKSNVKNYVKNSLNPKIDFRYSNIQK